MSISSNTILFNVRSAADFYNPLANGTNGNYHIFAAISNTYSNGVSENITESVKDLDNRYLNEIIFSKQVTQDDVQMMIDRYDWSLGTIYAQYDDTDADLFSKRFYVVAENNGWHVFKCLSNNNDSPSTVKPLFSETSPIDEIYTTSDGYVWKYMYSIENTIWNKFKTDKYIPVVENSLVAQYAKPGSIDSIVLVSGGNNYFSHTNGYFKATAISGNTRLYAIDVDTSSSNNSFYKNSAVYIDSGLGYGQVRKISDYINTGDQHQIVVETPFDIIPNTNSHYTIAPAVTIIGDGTGAVAVCAVSNNNSIEKFDIINRGQNYTFADVYVTGNTGVTTANNSQARAIMSPAGGHGSNVFSELNASKIAFSVQFSNTESAVVADTTKFSRIGILKDPVLANVWITYNSSNTGPFIADEQVTQFVTTTTDYNVYRANYSQSMFNVSDYVKLTLNAASSFANGATIVQSNNSLNAARVCSTSGSNLVVKMLSGNFIAGSPIQLSGNTAVNNVINVVSQGFINTIFGYNSENTAWSSTANNYDVFVNDNKIMPAKFVHVGSNNPNWSISSNVLTFTNLALSNTDQVRIDSYNYVASLSTKRLGSTGKLVSANSTVMKLTDVNSRFHISSDPLQSFSSNNSVLVTNAVGQPVVLDHTLRVYGQNQIGTVEVGDYLEQLTDGYVTAYGYVSSIKDEGSGNFTLRLVGVYGDIESSDGTDKYLQTKNTTKRFKVVSQIAPDVVKGSGKIIYAENVIPVGRSAGQPSETVKLVIKFY